MAGEWETAPLEKLVEPDRGISYGIVQPGPAVAEGVPIVRVTDVRNGRISTADPLRVSSQIEASYERTRLRGGELLLTLVGTVGETAVVPESLKGWNVARAVAVIPVRRDIGAYWVQTALKTPIVRQIVDSRLNTTVQATLNLRDVAQLPIVLPPQGERERIAHILGTLDDKIELNRRMNETLEAIARAIFKSWFIDFDPVRRNAARARNQPSPRPAAHPSPIGRGDRGEGVVVGEAIDHLFPDRFEDSELGEIPKGWRVMPAGEALTAVGGGTPSTKDPNYWDGGEYYWATPKDMSALLAPILLDTERKITVAGLAQISSGLLPAGTVLLSSRAPVGYLALAVVPTAINQGFIAMVCDGPVSNFYALNWCHLNMDEITQRASGTTFAEISKAAFRPIPMMVPDERVMERFTSYVRPFYETITGRLRESHTLAALRDTLLPKLISGELRVKHTERIVEIV